jgi:hypothetical protein
MAVIYGQEAIDEAYQELARAFARKYSTEEVAKLTPKPLVAEIKQATVQQFVDGLANEIESTKLWESTVQGRSKMHGFSEKEYAVMERERETAKYRIKIIGKMLDVLYMELKRVGNTPLKDANVW